ncbi:hypothetical protein EDD80_11130 [Anseongella ginsenosidimutans]|uniref:Uncharacterized protein n=1 Tax=Anseongella ginsenosidimutans TaxID=496056 RepID=A0A4R3KMQ2_9SPHI|nr:hypothetical protein EDD80_11130 [Anseongella ginsenosidimutans]
MRLFIFVKLAYSDLFMVQLYFIAYETVNLYGNLRNSTVINRRLSKRNEFGSAESE